MNIEAKLLKIIEDYRGEKVTATAASTFDELGFDSLDRVELLMKIEEDFDITFDDGFDFTPIETVGELIAAIERLAKN